jgi:hypothetical protein
MAVTKKNSISKKKVIRKPVARAGRARKATPARGGESIEYVAGDDEDDEDDAELALSRENEKFEQQWAAGKFKKLAEQVESEYQYGWAFIKPKIDEWAVRLKLYNNQKRDKEAIGDPLLFTIFQTVFAALYDDRLGVTFEGRESGDEDIAESLDSLAEFDYDEMEKDIIDYEWDWDTSFFGRGLVAMMDFDRPDKVPVPEVWDPMTVIRDPKAKSVNGTTRRRKGAAKFLYREVRMTKGEMKDAGVYFNLKDLKPDTNEIRSLLDRNSELRSEAQGLQPTNFMDSLQGESKTYHLLEGFTMHKGKLCFVTWGNGRQLLVRYQVMPRVHIPIIDRALYPIAHDWDGVSIPDLVEDKQRARSALQNMGLKSIKAGLNPMYIYNSNKITNRDDLNFEFNKFIPVNGDPSGAVMPMNKEGIKQEVNWILETLDGAAQRATASPDMQQGAVGDEKRTATELQLVDRKVGARYSLAARIFGWSEKRFWIEWYSLYKEYFEGGIDEKIIRIAGALGTKWRPLTRENIIASTDPDVRIESAAVSAAKRSEKFQYVRGWVAMIASDPNTNLRAAFKQMGRLSGLRKDEVDQIYPPTVDELIAEEENIALNANRVIPVRADDDHKLHLEVHNRAADTPAKYAHIRAHTKAIMLQRTNPEMFPQAESAMNPLAAKGGLPSDQPQLAVSKDEGL